MSPRRVRVVSGSRPAMSVQPSKIGWSQGPKIASRWSQVQIESQPAASAARAASRNVGQSVAWDQSWAPKRSGRAAEASAIGRSVVAEVVVDAGDPDPERHALLAHPTGPRLRVVVAVPIGEVADVLARPIEVIDALLEDASDPDPQHPVRLVEDRERAAPFARQVGRPAAGPAAVQEDRVVRLQAVPRDGLVG